MNHCSDGERRRVQLAMGLLRPWSILLLDEVTVDLDVLARARFLDFLKSETESRECTVVYATHIMDGLGGWPTHVVRLTLGECRFVGSMEDVEAKWGQEIAQESGGRQFRVWERNSGLLEVVLRWLKEDLEERGQRGIGPKQVGRDEDDGLHY
jgi:CCR4-NOT complex subunit CAF16